jgi:hypothetical protein
MYCKVALRDAGMTAHSHMILDRPSRGRLDAGFLRRMLLVLLAAFALAEFPAGARELFGPQAQLLVTLADERRLSEPAERSGPGPLQSPQDLNTESAGIDFLALDEADPVATPPANAPPAQCPGLSAAGTVAPWAAIVSPPCKAVRSRAPPAFA